MKKSLFIIGFASIITACSHTHGLTESPDMPTLRGEFEHGQTTRMVIEASGKKFEASGFPVTSRTNWAELSRMYRGTNPKRWDRIFAGHDKTYTFYSVDTTLRADDGSEMACKLGWQSGNDHAGLCVDKDGMEYQVRFK